MFKRSLIFTLSAVFLAGCATINKKEYAQEIQIRSVPSNATVELIDHTSGERKIVGQTPVNISVEKHADYMKARKYSILLSKSGYKAREFALESDVNGYYSWGNLLGANIIGWAIVDPATGAMWDYSAAKAEYVLNTNAGIEVLLEDDIKAKKALRAAKKYK